MRRHGLERGARPVDRHSSADGGAGFGAVPSPSTSPRLVRGRSPRGPFWPVPTPARQFRMTRRSLCSLPIVTVVVWLSRPALAQEPLKTVALDQAIQLALAHNTDSRSADEDVTSADGALVQSRLFSNPSLFVSSLARGVS